MGIIKDILRPIVHGLGINKKAPVLSKVEQWRARGSVTTYRFLCTYDEYVQKEREQMEKYPVSNVLFEDKTEEEWIAWKSELLKYGKGYDL